MFHDIFQHQHPKLDQQTTAFNMALWEKIWAEFMVWHGQQHVHIKHYQDNNKTKHNRWNPWAVQS